MLSFNPYGHFSIFFLIVFFSVIFIPQAFAVSISNNFSNITEHDGNWLDIPLSKQCNINEKNTLVFEYIDGFSNTLQIICDQGRYTMIFSDHNGDFVIAECPYLFGQNIAKMKIKLHHFPLESLTKAEIVNTEWWSFDATSPSSKSLSESRDGVMLLFDSNSHLIQKQTLKHSGLWLNDIYHVNLDNVNFENSVIFPALLCRTNNNLINFSASQ